MLPNGCELSGRGSLSHEPNEDAKLSYSLAFAAESPGPLQRVVSLLGKLMQVTHLLGDLTGY
jgi:hypothetical protein